MLAMSANPMSRIFRLLSPRRRAPRAPARNPRRLEVEALEDRMCPSGGYLLVGSFDNNSVLRYSETTGAFVDQFDPHNLANLKNPGPGVFGPDGNLYVSSGVFLNNNQKVVKYNGTTGAFQSVFASQNVTSPRGLLFGPGWQPLCCRRQRRRVGGSRLRRALRWQNGGVPELLCCTQQRGARTPFVHGLRAGRRSLRRCCLRGSYLQV